ncbi:MAG: putative bifunctional diguanylate cyclase/phosphodiesterase [Pyrinomonadaceae bacterium]
MWLVFATIAGCVLIFKKKTALKTERERTELAEKHNQELQLYIAEQEKQTKALHKTKEKFRHAAFHDQLTDLPNRNYFIENLKFMLEKSLKTPDFKFAVLFLDLNRFKTINESLGHATGDKLILHVAKRLSNCIREGDLLARFGGDEFAFILSNAEDLQAIGFADRIKRTLSEPFILGSRKVFTSVSIGIATSRNGYKEAENILRDADIAMCYAKDRGQTYKIFDSQMHAKAMSLMQFETDLRFAIERNEFSAFFQPIIDLNTMTLSGFESLIRWNHPKHGMVSPVEFIPVAEETGLIVPITLWMLEESCRQLKIWQQKFPQNSKLFVSVNLSGKHFTGEDLVQQVGQILYSTLIDPRCLKLEITESAMMENPDEVISILGRLKSLGVQLSIDDFGTGYSSLSYLHKFPVDSLKVDRSFVMAMDKGTENGEIIKTIVSLAKTLRMKTIAEGIETIDQLHMLSILGCHYGQGYLFSRPVPAADAVEFLLDPKRWQNVLPEISKTLPPMPVTQDESWRLRLME